MQTSLRLQIESHRCQQALALRKSRYYELCALARCSGGSPRWGRRKGPVQAAATFGLAGVCGCGTCGICQISSPSQGDCRCGASCCPSGSRLRKEDSRGFGMLGEWGGGLGPGRFPDPSVHIKGNDSFFDMHSHNFCASEWDWYATLAMERLGHVVANTEMEQRIEWLYQFVNVGIVGMVISGMYDPGEDSPSFPSVEGALLDEITAHAWARHPDFFVPFVRGFDLDDPDAPSYVESWLEAGFCGVGELFVHGHHFDYNDVSTLVDIFTVAAKFGVPVQVHWEIGNVDDEAVRTAEANFAQLLAVLDSFPNKPVTEYIGAQDGPPPLKLILAHCGAGPQDPTPGVPGDEGMSEEARDAYEKRLDILLKDYPNVYFDIAGNVGASPDLWYSSPFPGRASPLGDLILMKMKQEPSRFLLGLDVENKSEEQIQNYINTIPQYTEYLDYQGLLDSSSKELIKFKNAQRVLNLHTMGTPGNFGKLSWP